MKEIDQFELMVVGLGGFGALMIGKLFAEAATSKYKHVTYLANYGPLVRMGDSECTVILSHDQVAAPVVLRPQALIVMGPVPLDSFQKRLRPGSTVLLDSSFLSDELSIEDAKVYHIPAANRSQELGDGRVANLIFLGAYLEASKTAPLELVEDLLEKRLRGGKREDLLPLNKKALREGARLMREMN